MNKCCGLDFDTHWEDCPNRPIVRDAMMSEFDETVKLAKKLMEEPYADPDDDLRMLSRQFLRALEKVSRLETELAGRSLGRNPIDPLPSACGS